ncbi:MAG: LVIVD repeat protein [uncultured bacterium]|nr:MAG: LVIVD repeat protein [uncultured bacterium]
MKAVFVGTSGKVYLSNLKNFNTDVLLEFSGEKFSQATWVGSGNVAVVSAGGVSLINIDSKERKDIFKNAPNEKVSEIIADNNGEVVAYSVTGSEDIHFYIMNSGEEFISEKNVNPSMLLGFSGIGVIDYQIDVKFPEDEKDGSDEELKLLSKIGNLSGKASSDVHIDGNYLYRINVEGDLLEVFDISDKKNPKEIASVIDTVNINSGEIDSYLFDGYLYIAGGPLAIIDVTNSSVPKLIYSSEHMDARHVAVFGNYAYVAGKDRFTVMNVSDKAKPQIVFDTKASDLNVAVLPEKQAILKELSEVSLWGDLELSSDGKRLYAGCGDKGLKILDVSNPEVPKVLYRENTGFVSEIAGTGENVYVGRKSLGADVFVGAKKIGSIDEQLFGNGFEISEQKLYSISPKIAVYDLSDPLKPSQLTELENSDTMKDRRAINVEGNIMVVLAEDLYIYSVNLDKK